jgi:ribosomal protein L32
MSKKKISSSRKRMVKISNSLNRCFCGQPFDSDGVCANGHIQDQEYFFPENEVRNKRTNKTRNKKRNKSTKLTVCKPFACRCSICGAYIPEGDNVCDNGHMIGVEYPNS